MTKSKPPAKLKGPGAAPRDWSPEARSLWQAIHKDFQLDEHHVALLRAACEQLTRAESARRAIKKHGLLVKSRFGSLAENPAVAIERSAVNAARLLIRELGLDVEGPVSETYRLPRAIGYD